MGTDAPVVNFALIALVRRRAAGALEHGFFAARVVPVEDAFRRFQGHRNGRTGEANTRLYRVRREFVNLRSTTRKGHEIGQLPPIRGNGTGNRLF
jgi:hypothetical protein